jgi:hypothetical protein
MMSAGVTPGAGGVMIRRKRSGYAEEAREKGVAVVFRGRLPHPGSRDDAVIDKTVCWTVVMLNTQLQPVHVW